MRILEICMSQYLGGLEMYHTRCCQMLSDAGHDITAVCFRGSRIEERHQGQPYRKYGLDNFNRYFPVTLAMKLARLIRSHNIEIIHVHHSWDLLLCVLAKGWSGTDIRLIYTRQMEYPFAKHNPYHRWLYSRIDIILCITKKLMSDARRHLPVDPGRIHHLYYGTPPSVTGSRDCHTLSHWTNTFKVAVFSRIQYSKGQQTVVETAAILKEKGINLHFFFYGDVMVEEDMQTLETIIEKNGLEDRVHFMGFADNPRALMGCFDVLIQPSKRETFGLVLIEAMREGVAVIGTNSGGIPEVIDHDKTGLLFEFSDSEALARHLLRLYNEPDTLERLSRAGKEKADREFDEADHFSRLQEEFQRALE